MKNIFKYILLLFIVGIVANGEILTSGQLFNKTTVKVKRKNIKISKIYYAKTYYDESKIYDISLRYSGFIKNLYANENHKFITKNQKLFDIYSKEVVATFDELILAIKFKKNKEFIQSIENKLKLLEIPQDIINSVKKTKKTPYYIKYISPYSGFILDKKINNSSYIKEGETIFKIVDLSTLWVNVFVYQDDLDFIKSVKFANIFINNKKIKNAKIDFIHPFVDENKKTINVRIKITNKNLDFLANMFAKVEFVQDIKNLLILPKNAVITKGDKHYVFKMIDKNNYEPIEIKGKRISSDIFVVDSGLDENDIVINNALFMLDSDAITNGLYDNDDEDW